MAEYIIVDDPDSVNEFVLFRGGGEEGMRADVLCAYWLAPHWDDSDGILISGLL